LRLIVVGSGIVGASCAHAASALGAEVVLVDAAKQGRATAAGAGIICPWSARVTDPAWRALAYAAAREYPALIARLAGALADAPAGARADAPAGAPAGALADALADPGGIDVGYRQVGALFLGEDREEFREALLERRAEAPEIGEVAELSGAEARRLFPPLRADAAAVYVGGAARVDGRKLAAALARAAVRQGALVIAGSAELVVDPGPGPGRGDGFGRGRVVGVRVGGEVIEGDAVVAATGAWTGSFLQPTGLAVPVEPQRGQIMHISLGDVDTSRWPVLLPGAGGHYMLAFDGGRIVAGATRETGSGFDYRVTPAGLAEILGQALAVAPGLADGTYLETRVGFRPMGPGIRPLLGPVPGLDGLVVATGLGASGLTMGPLAGSLAAQAALGLPPAIDLEPFAPPPALRRASGHLLAAPRSGRNHPAGGAGP
jgi:D-amino-acid dehydrogenase